VIDGRSLCEELLPRAREETHKSRAVGQLDEVVRTWGMGDVSKVGTNVAERSGLVGARAVSAR
jgi:hypothetical protein